jgi:SagB-type dehydrogenase family enzyme
MSINWLYRWTVILCFVLIMTITNACRGVSMSDDNNRQLMMSNTGNRIELPEPSFEGNISIEEALKLRASVRNFSSRNLTREQLAQILWAAQGINRPGTRFRTSPSAGATYPLETYAVTPEGIFRYIAAEHSMISIREGDHRRELAGAALGQSSVSDAPLSVIFTAEYRRTTNRYGNRGIMYVHMEAGHAAQNVHLQGVAMGLGSVAIGAFEPEKVANIIRTEEDEIAIYIIPVGYPAGSDK